MKARLILVAHGSRRPAWRAPLDDLCARMQRRLGADAVRLAFMELCPPDLPSAVAEARRDGVGHVRVLPLFMSSGGHVEHDIAPTLAELGAAHDDLTLELLPALGEHPLILDALCTIASTDAEVAR